MRRAHHRHGQHGGGGKYGVHDGGLGIGLDLSSSPPLSIFPPFKPSQHQQHQSLVLTPSSAPAAAGGAVGVLASPLVGRALDDGLPTMPLPTLGLGLLDPGGAAESSSGGRGEAQQQQDQTLAVSTGLGHQDSGYSDTASALRAALDPIAPVTGMPRDGGGLTDVLSVLDLEPGPQQPQQQQLGVFGQLQGTEEVSPTARVHSSSRLENSPQDLVRQTAGGLADLGMELGLGVTSDLNNINAESPFNQDLSVGQMPSAGQQQLPFLQPQRRPQQQRPQQVCVCLRVGSLVEVAVWNGDECFLHAYWLFVFVLMSNSWNLFGRAPWAFVARVGMLSLAVGFSLVWRLGGGLEVLLLNFVPA